MIFKISSSKKQAALKSFAALLILCLAACDSTTTSPPSPQITQQSVQTTGPFWSGTRSNVYTRNDGEDVTVQIWYPTSDEMGDTVRYDNLLDGDSWVDATPDCTASRPVVVFSHGNGGVRWQSAFNMHFLATHGFVVIAMGHPQNTFRDLDRNLFPEHTLQRPKDVKDTFDWLIQQGTTESNDLFGCINPEEGYAVMGHSFGGYTSFMASGATVELTQIEAACDRAIEAACRIASLWQAESDATTISLHDPRIWAAITWSPWDAGGVLGDGMGAIDVPTLTLTGTLDELTPLDQVSSLANAAPDADYVQLIDAGHFSFAPFFLHAHRRRRLWR